MADANDAVDFLTSQFEEVIDRLRVNLAGAGEHFAIKNGDGIGYVHAGTLHMLMSALQRQARTAADNGDIHGSNAYAYSALLVMETLSGAIRELDGQ